jgi:thymidylate synthase
MNTSIKGMQFANPTEAFEDIYNIIMSEGESFASTKAIFNTNFTVLDPIKRVISTPQRKFNQDYAEYEWEWYLKGDRDAQAISERAKIWKLMMIPDTTEVNSNYGYYWNYNNQLNRAIEELKSNKETRRAIVVHYLLDELDRYKYDTPCNDVLNFYIKDDKLHLTVFARSIDLVYGFCNDQFCFSKLMDYVSEKTGYDIGTMNWMITNLHIYERHYNLIQQ